MITMRRDIKDEKGRMVWNVYHCTGCTDAGVEHQVNDVDAGLSDATCQWGTGLPMTKQKCSGCGKSRGPFISTKYTGDGW